MHSRAIHLMGIWGEEDRYMKRIISVTPIYLHLNCRLFPIMLRCSSAALSFNPAPVRYRQIDGAFNRSFALLNITQVVWLIGFSLTPASSITSVLFKILNEIVSAVCRTLSPWPVGLEQAACEIVITTGPLTFPTRTHRRILTAVWFPYWL